MSGRNAHNSDVSDDEMETDQAVRAGMDSDEEGGIRVDEDIYIPALPPMRAGAAADEPRLMIHEIVNENFKSYANSVTIGPFDKCFSAIIGPNGSGKSNVIDAMLFVFGYRSNSIRTKKISELIHNSVEHPNVRSCKVSIHFRRIVYKPDGTFETIPNSKIVISRTVFKDNSSFYELNHKKVRMKEINKLLKSEGIDLDYNRFLILQGEVEQIAMMKPKGQNENDEGMLEFLENIIGTSRYKEPLEKLSEKVEDLTERRAEKLNRLRVVEKEKNDLVEPMQDAVEYLQLENSITKYQHQFYHCKRSETKSEIAEKEAKKKELDTDLGDLIAEMKKIHDEKAEKSKEFKEKCKRWDSLQKEKDAATLSFDTIKKRDEALHAELVETNKRRKEDQASLKTEKDKLTELAKVPEKNAKSIEECETLVEKSEVSLKKEEALLEKLKKSSEEKSAPLIEQRKLLETKLIPLNDDVDKAKKSYDLAKSELEIYTSAEHTEKDKLAKLKETLATVSESLKDHEEKMSSLNKKIPATEQSLVQAQKELETLITLEKELSAKLKDKRIRYEEHSSAMKASKSQNHVIESLMEEKRSGRLPGIFGRLGDLGAIDAKYDIAISTACGALDNVVVDTADTGEGCINFLRQNDIGRMNFIALDRQSHLEAQCRKKIQTPENVPRLFDLIKVQDERVLPAFYFAIRDTLVANDLDQATRIAYGARRHRVVTLQGAVIEVAGTMSGGGRPLKGRMGQKVVQNEISTVDLEKLEKERDEVFEEYRRVQLRQQPLKNQIQTLSNALHDMKIDRPKYDAELKSLIDQEPRLRVQLKVQTQIAGKAVSDPKRVEQLTKALKGAQKNLELATERSKELRAAADRLKEEIDEIIGGGAVKEQEKKINALTKSIEKANAEITRLQVAIKTAERNTKKSEQKIETLENDVKSCEQKIRDKQREKIEFENEAKLILEKLSELNEALAERDELAGSFKKELSALEARDSKMKALKIDLDQKISESNKVLKDLERMIPEYTRKIASLKLHEIPGKATETLKDLTDEEVEELDIKKVAASLQRAKQRLPEEIPNMQIIKDYQMKEAAYLKRSADLEEITNARKKLRDIFDIARRRRCDEFLAGFSIITGKLKEMYQMITMDGDAELELVDSMDPFSEGVVFSVRPPKKSWKNISNLSGGEKTLSSLALVFALHHYKPSPVYFMDEIDAALDFKNVSIIGNFIKERAKNSQFIVVSLRENMYELANILVGIYKTHNTTKVAPLSMTEFNKHHPKPKTTMSLQSVKNRYASQVPRATTQPPPKAQMPATCPAAIEEAEALDSTAASDVSLGLGDTALPVTPAQTPRSRYSSSSDIVEGTPERKSLRKRRRL